MHSCRGATALAEAFLSVTCHLNLEGSAYFMTPVGPSDLSDLDRCI